MLRIFLTIYLSFVQITQFLLSLLMLVREALSPENKPVNCYLPGSCLSTAGIKRYLVLSFITNILMELDSSLRPHAVVE